MKMKTKAAQGSAALRPKDSTFFLSFAASRELSKTPKLKLKTKPSQNRKPKTENWKPSEWIWMGIAIEVPFPRLRLLRQLVFDPNVLYRLRMRPPLAGLATHLSGLATEQSSDRWATCMEWHSRSARVTWAPRAAAHPRVWLGSGRRHTLRVISPAAATAPISAICPTLLHQAIPPQKSNQLARCHGNLSNYNSLAKERTLSKTVNGKYSGRMAQKQPQDEIKL